MTAWTGSEDFRFATEKSLLCIRPVAKTYQALLWTQMADEARAAANHLSDEELRLCVLAVAEQYEALAKRAESVGEERRE